MISRPSSTWCYFVMILWIFRDEPRKRAAAEPPTAGMTLSTSNARNHGVISSSRCCRVGDCPVSCAAISRRRHADDRIIGWTPQGNRGRRRGIYGIRDHLGRPCHHLGGMSVGDQAN